MGRTLHITNGDGAAGLIKASAIAGDVLSWRDPMHHGPMPPGLDLAALSTVRAAYFSEPGLSAADAFRDRDRVLQSAAAYEFVVLWFEHDLLDQLQILQILDWFAAPEHEHPGLQMICIGAFEGLPNFRGLGQLSPEQIATLWPDRRPMPVTALAAARDGWAAFRSENPKSLERYLPNADRVTPFMRPCLLRHLQEFPDSVSGLMRSEKHVLDVVAAGEPRPGAAFGKMMDLEQWLFGGDLRFFTHVADLANGDTPLLKCTPGPKFLVPHWDGIDRETFLAQRLELTAVGTAVLSSAGDAFDLMARDMHLGGVYVQSGRPMWTWNARQGALELRD